MYERCSQLTDETFLAARMFEVEVKYVLRGKFRVFKQWISGASLPRPGYTWLSPSYGGKTQSWTFEYKELLKILQNWKCPVEVRGLGEHPHLHQRINQRRWELLADWSSWLKGSTAATEEETLKNRRTSSLYMCLKDGLSWKASLCLC